MPNKPKDGPRRASSNKSSDKQIQNKRQNRRRLIQVLALGGGIASAKLIPDRWATPAVKSVLLPAHAAGSECTLGNTEPTGITDSTPAGPIGEGSIAQKVIDTLVPEAWGDSAFELTGCFRIDFICNSNEGDLTASVVELDTDLGTPQYKTVHFDFGVCTELVVGIWFRVKRADDAQSAKLFLGPDCANLNIGPILLVPEGGCDPSSDSAT